MEAGSGSETEEGGGGGFEERKRRAGEGRLREVEAAGEKDAGAERSRDNVLRSILALVGLCKRLWEETNP